MKRYIPLLCFLTLFPPTCFSQNAKIDSLQNALRSAKEDTSRVNLLNALAELNRNIDPDTCILLAQEALALSARLQYIAGQASANLWMGTAHTNLGNYAPALEKLDRAKKLTEQLLSATPNSSGHQTLLARILNNTGNVHWKKADYNQALANSYAALRIKIGLGDKLQIADSYNNIGNIQLDMGNYPDALKYQFAALKLREALKDSGSIADSYINIGNVYFKQSNYKLAGEYYLRSLQIKKQLGHKRGVATAYANLSNVYSNEGKIAEALTFSQEALAFNQSLGDKGRVALNYTNIATLYLALGDTPRALENHFTSLKIKEDIGEAEGIMTSLNNIAFIYVMQKKAKEALRYFNRSLETGSELGSKEDMMMAYNGLYQADSLLGNSKEGLRHFKLYIAYRDSLFNEENTKKQVRSEMNFEFEKKEAVTKAEQERKDAVAEADKKRQRVVLLAISVFGSLVLGFAIFAYRSFLQKKKANIEISMQKQLIEEKQKEILDSIHYAKRIQNCLLPQEKYIERCLKFLK